MKNEIIGLTTIKKGEKEDPYLQKFYNEEFCSEFSEVLKTKIRMLYQEEKDITPYWIDYSWILYH